MKLLIFGVAGMLGHKLYQALSPDFDVVGTIRGDVGEIGRYSFFDAKRVIPRVDVFHSERVESAIQQVKPDAVVNCVGMIKQRQEAYERPVSIWVNSWFPHQLYRTCRREGIRLVHISTDCVFSGKRGNYREDDPSDAEDVYGKTKFLGEVSGPGALTVRTSLVGRELATSHGLVEWFLANKGRKVDGFTNVIFSGFPTVSFAPIIADILARRSELEGVRHVSSGPISKHRFLTLLRDQMKLDIEIRECEVPCCDRSLDSTAYRAQAGFEPASWEHMVQDLAQDACQYQGWRGA